MRAQRFVVGAVFAGLILGLLPLTAAVAHARPGDDEEGPAAGTCRDKASPVVGLPGVTILGPMCTISLFCDGEEHEEDSEEASTCTLVVSGSVGPGLLVGMTISSQGKQVASCGPASGGCAISSTSATVNPGDATVTCASDGLSLSPDTKLTCHARLGREREREHERGVRRGQRR